jgi:hypothetical protein
VNDRDREHELHRPKGRLGIRRPNAFEAYSTVDGCKTVYDAFRNTEGTEAADHKWKVVVGHASAFAEGDWLQELAHLGTRIYAG